MKQDQALVKSKTQAQFVIEPADFKRFLAVIKSLETMNEEITMQYDQTDITIRTMDPSHVALMDIVIPKLRTKNQEDQDIVGKFGLRTKELLEVISNFDGSAATSLTVGKERLAVIGVTKSGITQSHAIRMVGSSATDTPLPSIEFNAWFNVTTDQQRELLKAFKSYEYIGLEGLDNNTIRYYSSADQGEISMSIRHAESSITYEENAMYGMEYLAPLLRQLITTKQGCQIKYSTEKPCVVKLLDESWQVDFYLAPRVET